MKKYMALCLGAALLLSGCGQEAADPAKPATVTIAMTSMDAWHRGVTAYQAGKTNEAIAYYDKAIQADANNFHALSDKGIALALEGDYQGAKPYLMKALEIAPKSAAVHYNLAMYHKLQGHLDEALHEFETVLQTDPQNAWSLYGIATIHADRGNEKDALAYLARAIEADISVRDAARTQDHFAAYHDHPQFRQLVGE